MGLLPTICGLKGMEDGINTVLKAHAEAEGVPWALYRNACNRAERGMMRVAPF
jgi:hypothetical protein